MPRIFTEETLVIGSHNSGKVREIKHLFQKYVPTVISARDLHIPEPEETEQTFIGNAVLKARFVSQASNHVTLSDDSGLCVNALDGAPGIYSARWAGPEKDFSLANTRIIDLLKTATDRSAYFVCALALAWPDGHTETFEGRVSGVILPAPKGEAGFGYDPIFMPEGYTTSFGEMDPERKHAISHRAQAFQALVNQCFPAHHPS